jgi:hypothetical protein
MRPGPVRSPQPVCGLPAIQQGKAIILYLENPCLNVVATRDARLARAHQAAGGGARQLAARICADAAQTCLATRIVAFNSISYSQPSKHPGACRIQSQGGGDLSACHFTHAHQGPHARSQAPRQRVAGRVHPCTRALLQARGRRGSRSGKRLCMGHYGLIPLPPIRLKRGHPKKCRQSAGSLIFRSNTSKQWGGAPRLRRRDWPQGASMGPQP